MTKRKVLGLDSKMFFKIAFVGFLTSIGYTSASPASNGLSIPLQRLVKSHPLHANVGSTPVSSSFPRQKRQLEPLSGVDHGLSWAGNIIIGGQTFFVLFDTGSSDLWVTSKECESEFCQHRRQYYTRSGSAKLQDGTFEISFMDGSSVSGPVYTDTVLIGGVSVRDQYFSSATDVSGLDIESSDGMVGLGSSARSVLKQPSFLENAFAQGSVHKAEFSMCLADQGSELFLGGSNSNLYTGDFESHNIEPESLWLLRGVAISVGGTKVISGFTSFINSGTTFIRGPPSAVKRLYDAIPGSSALPGSDIFYLIPCLSAKYQPVVTFNWGGRDWAIPSENFYTVIDSLCVGVVFAADDGESDWVIGDAFMKTVYTKFSLADGTVSFAALKH